MMAKYPPGKDNHLSREVRRLEKENEQLQSQLAEAEREMDELKAGYAFIGDFEFPPTVTEQIKDIIEKGKRREWVRDINYAIDDYKREYVGHGVETLFNDLAKRIESGEVEL